MTSPTTNPNRAALIGLLFFAPFFVLNLLVGQDNAAIDTFFRSVFSLPGIRTNPLGHLVFAVCVLLIPIGSVIALRPVFQRRAGGTRRVYVLNLLLGGLTLLFFIVLAGALISEVYRCDVLLIPNCD